MKVVRDSLVASYARLTDLWCFALEYCLLVEKLRVDEYVRFYVKQALTAAAKKAQSSLSLSDAFRDIPDCFTPRFPDSKTIKTAISKACDR